MDKEIVSPKEVYTNLEIDYDTYKPTFGTYKPVFKGLPPNYYPNTKGNVVLIIVLLIISWIGMASIFYGCLHWLLAEPVDATYYSIGIYCFFVILMIVLMFIGGAIRIKKEKEMIEAKLRKEGMM